MFAEVFISLHLKAHVCMTETGPTAQTSADDDHIFLAHKNLLL